jgi:hypothetical protein
VLLLPALLRLGFVVLGRRFGLFLWLVLLAHIFRITLIVFHIADQDDPGGKLGDRRLSY